MISITAEELVKKTGVGTYIQISDEYSYSLPSPKSINNDLYGQFKEESVSFPKTFILRLPEAMVAGEIGIAIYKEYLIEDTAIRKEFLSYPDIIKVDRDCTSISHLWANNNYFHWLLSSLSRVSLLKAANLFNKEGLFFVNSLNKYEIDGFTKVGMRYVQPNNNKWWKCRNLTISSPMSNDSITSPIRCKYLRDNLITNRKSGVDKVAIRRKSGRTIVNEKEVYEYLESIGYVSVYCEDYSFEDQISLFKGAKYVISPHGAGLANIVFCEEGTKVLELLSPLYLNTCFRKVAAYSELDYYFLIGEGEISLEENPKSDILVDINKLKKVIERMMIC